MEYQYLDTYRYYQDLALNYEEDAKFYQGEAARYNANPSLKNQYEEKANEALRQAKQHRQNASDAKGLFEYYRRHNG
jgi:hypothetical protein